MLNIPNRIPAKTVAPKLPFQRKYPYLCKKSNNPRQPRPFFLYLCGAGMEMSAMKQKDGKCATIFSKVKSRKFYWDENTVVIDTL